MFCYHLISIFVLVQSMSVPIDAIGRTQSAGAMGVLNCNGKPASNVLVKLYDSGIAIDTLLGQGKTDQNGRFQISGTTSEITNIDPKLNIYHDCDDNLPCQRKVTIIIPSSYISSGTTVQRFYNIGSLNLAGKVKGESRDCIHK